MAKDLPYFKFNVSEWNDGDVTLCSMAAQGLFINLCSLYWSQEGNLSLEKCKRRYKDCNTPVWEELTIEGIIKVDGDQITIRFLDEQFEERQKLSETNAKNVRKRWKKQGLDTTVLQPNNDGKEVVYNIEERRGEKKRGDLEQTDFFDSNQKAFEEISTNYLEMEPARNVVRNNGWSTVTDADVNALLFHFLESQVDLKKQDKSDVKSHFRRWLNKQPTNDLTRLSTSIHARRKRQ